MFVALATPDLSGPNGSSQTRPNIIDEIRSARQRPHLRSRIQIFKASAVELPSNINPTYDALDPADIGATFSLFERQARTYGILAPSPRSASPQGTSAPSDVEVSEPEDAKAQKQAIDSLEELADLLRGRDCADIGSAAARAHLASSTVLAAHRSAENLGVHEINGLYRERRGVVATGSETMFLLRTIVSNIGSDNAPGWYWFRDLSSAEIRSRVVELAMSDADNRTQGGALELLSNSPEAPSPSELRAVINGALDNKEEFLGSKALALLEKHGTRRDIQVLQPVLDAYADKKSVRRACLVVVAREMAGTAFRQVIGEPSSLSDETEKLLVAAASKVPHSVTRQSLSSPSVAIRSLGLRILHANSRLKKEDVEGVVATDPEQSVRVLAAELAVKRRWRLSPQQIDAALEGNSWEFEREARLKASYWATWKVEALIGKLEYDLESTYVYEALSLHHFDAIEARIVGDLEDDFAELKKQSRLHLEQEFKDAAEADAKKREGEVTKSDIDKVVASGVAQVLERRKKTEKFLLKRFRAAALAGLSRNGSERHLPIARRFLAEDDRELVEASIRLIRRKGDDSDVPALLEIVRASWGDVQKEAAKAALAIAEEPIDTALGLLEENADRVVGSALEVLRQADWERTFYPVWDLLRDANPSVREQAIVYFIDRLEELQNLPEAYARGQYYYNVVTRVDRQLYAPDWVKQATSRILGS